MKSNVKLGHNNKNILPNKFMVCYLHRGVNKRSAKKRNNKKNKRIFTQFNQSIYIYIHMQGVQENCQQRARFLIAPMFFSHHVITSNVEENPVYFGSGGYGSLDANLENKNFRGV